ncbi:hypothetical protein NKDENANG_02231 [Candidatus Entotheonellaceae bacterium PAL068K]
MPLRFTGKRSEEGAVSPPSVAVGVGLPRRVALRFGLIATVWALTSAHTPYRQWSVYRQRHLFILTSKTDGLSYVLGKRVAEILAVHLPNSQARVTRAPYTERVASLISSKQMEVALLSRGNAIAMHHGWPPFADSGPVALRRIIGLGEYLLVCRNDFPARHAYLVAKTLSTNHAELAVPVSPGGGGAPEPEAAVPIHPGALAYFQGRPPPAPGAKAE